MEIATGLKVKLQRHLKSLPVNLKDEKRRVDLPQKKIFPKTIESFAFLKVNDLQQRMDRLL